MPWQWEAPTILWIAWLPRCHIVGMLRLEAKIGWFGLMMSRLAAIQPILNCFV